MKIRKCHRAPKIKGKKTIKRLKTEYGSKDYLDYWIRHRPLLIDTIERKEWRKRYPLHMGRVIGKGYSCAHAIAWAIAAMDECDTLINRRILSEEYFYDSPEYLNNVLVKTWKEVPQEVIEKIKLRPGDKL